MSSRVAVVLGGGVSGLATAYYLQKLAPSFQKIILLESSPRLGGWIDTYRCSDGAVFERGPRSLRPAGVAGINTLDLADELGLGEQVLSIKPSNPAAKNRFIYLNGQIYKLPSGIGGILRKTEPFSKALIWSALREPFASKAKTQDESVYDFACRKMGTEFADYLLDPMCRGIFAGSASELSLAAALPVMRKLESQGRGSLIAGAVAQMRVKKPERHSHLSKLAASDHWALWTFRGGMQSLVDGLTDAIQRNERVTMRTNVPCTAVKLTKQRKLEVTTSDDTITADHVFACIPSTILSSLLGPEPVLLDLKTALSQITAASVAVVNLEYKGDILQQKGFGHLLPSFEGGPILGVVYDSCTFPELSRKGSGITTRLTMMLGGAWYNDLIALSKDAGEGDTLSEEFISKLAVETVARHLNVPDPPSKVLVAIQEACIPQYRVGHLELLRQIDVSTEQLMLPISYLGSSYRGVSVNDCIHNAKLEVQRIRQ